MDTRDQTGEPEHSSNEKMTEKELVREVLKLVAEGKMPTIEEIEQAAREAVSEVMAETSSPGQGLGTAAPWTCPICGSSCENTDACEHLALQRFDDSDECTTRGVFYSDSGQVDYIFDNLYEEVLHFSMVWLSATGKMRGVVERAGETMTPLKSLLQTLQTISVEDTENEYFEDIVPGAYYDTLKMWFNELFTSVWKRQPTSVAAGNYVITNSPGMSWSGTHYWSEDGAGCLPTICNEIELVAAEVHKLVQAARDELASCAGTRSSLDKAEAWITTYRRFQSE